MDFDGKTVVVTGGASGIGAALAAAFHHEGARVCVLDLPGNKSFHKDFGFFECDVTSESGLNTIIQKIGLEFGQIDVFVSNAGTLSEQPDGAASSTNDDWTRCWSLNVMSHVYAARALLPSMIARGSGYFVNIASAAGLLNQIGDAAYSATKHAAVSFAESLAITHKEDGIGVSLVCPQYVATPLIGLADDDAEKVTSLLTAGEVASCTLEAVKARQFLVLPHANVKQFVQSRARNHDEWISGMARLRSRSVDTFGDARPNRFYQLV